MGWWRSAMPPAPFFRRVLSWVVIWFGLLAVHGAGGRAGDGAGLFRRRRLAGVAVLLVVFVILQRLRMRQFVRAIGGHWAAAGETQAVFGPTGVVIRTTRSAAPNGRWPAVDAVAAVIGGTVLRSGVTMISIPDRALPRGADARRRSAPGWTHGAGCERPTCAVAGGAGAAAIALWERCGSLRPWNPPAADIAAFRAHPAAELLVAFEGDRAVASVAVGHDGHRGWVYYVASDPARRGRGLGRAAMAAAETWLSARGVAKLQLLVREANAGVLGFYEALGYEDGACRLMQKWLDPGRDRLYREAADGG